MNEQHFNALPQGYQLQEYTVQSVLGHGGFGITYLATDNNLGKDVAIKEYLPTEFAVRGDDSRVHPRSTADNDDYQWGLDRFMKEAQTLGLFRHPNIVPVYRAFKANETAYMVMEYQRGQPLTELFRRHRDEFTEEDLTNLILPLLDGLAVVHRAGYLHRDLKPGNVFIREDGSPVLLDFGAARNAVGRKSKNLTSIVTPGYAPLEQYFADGNQGPWTDIYAMASILYQAVAGRIPPEAPARVKRDPITPAVEAGRGRFSEHFLAAIDTGLRVEEEQRPQTVEQWRAMLLGQEVPSARPFAPPPRETASRRDGSTMFAGQPAPGAPASSMAGSPSMRFPTIAREDALAHRRRGGGAGRMAAIVIGGAVLLAASGVGAYIALNPDHGFFGASNTRTNNTTTVSSDADKRRAEEEARRSADEEKRRAAEESKRRAEEEAKRRSEEEAKRRADAERKADEERRRRQQDDSRRAEEERRKQEEARRAEEEARRRDEERRAEDEKRRQAEEEKRRAEEERKREEARRREEDERKNARTGGNCDFSVIKGVYTDETMCYFQQRAIKFALDQSMDGGPPTRWAHASTGASGMIKIVATVRNQDGTMCRRFQETATINGRTHSASGTACLRPGGWQIVG
jgi:serine/threonine protein kinase